MLLLSRSPRNEYLEKKRAKKQTQLRCEIPGIKIPKKNENMLQAWCDTWYFDQSVPQYAVRRFQSDEIWQFYVQFFVRNEVATAV